MMKMTNPELFAQGQPNLIGRRMLNWQDWEMLADHCPMKNAGQMAGVK
jgi:hypothetical protein